MNRAVRDFGHSLCRTLADDWLPRHCALCDRRLADRCAAVGALCAPCFDSLPGRDATRCEICGLHAARPRCPACVDPPPFTRTLVACDYSPPLDRWIVAMKYGGDTALADSLGALLAWRAAPLAGRIDLVAHVPPSRARLLERGFDHAARLARPVARALDRPAPGSLLSRTRDTPTQSRLARADRTLNLRNAFAASPAVHGRRIALVDDVMTTGTTLREAATTLRAAGAAEVVALVVARTA